MSRTKKIFFAVLALVCLSRLGYAAVRQINETEYGFTPMALSGDSGTGDGSTCGFDPCPSAYTGGTVKCEYHNAKDGRGCEAKTCCNGNTPVSVNECPSALSFSVSDTDDLANLSTLEYCDGYRGGVKAVYLYEDPAQCSIKGITNTTYLSALNTSSSCGSSSGVIQKNCLRSDGGNVNYCELSATTGYQACPAGDTTYSPYPHTDCDATPDRAAIPCYIQCGDARYCVGYTCKTDNLPSCSSLESQKEGEGYFSSGISTTYDAAKGFIYQCLDSGVVKYMGFYCQGYYTQSDCTGSANNGTTGGECTVYLAGGGTDKVYACTCGTSRTLETFCSEEHAGDANCTDNYYGVDGKCILDKSDTGATLIKYKTFSSNVGLCTAITDWKYSDKLSGSACTSFSGETAPVTGQCRIINSDTTSTIKDICKYCQNYIAGTLADAQAQCVNGTPVECHYSASNVVYSGCSCAASGFKTVAEWCTASFPSNTSCGTHAVGSGKECHTQPNNSASDTIYYEKITCGSSFYLRDDWCAANPDLIADGYKCTDYIGLGEPCILDAEGDTSKYKYTSFGLGCPTGADTTAKSTTEECLLEGENKAVYDTCYAYDEDTKKYTSKYICKCPASYGTECEEAYKIRGGTVCTFDRNASGVSITKYSDCKIACGNEYAINFSKTPYDCEDVDTYVATIRGGIENPEMCIISGDRTENFICGCPKNFKTINEWCEDNYISEGLESAYECISSYTGRGEGCSKDIETDTAGNPTRVLSKYAYYVRYCPTTRPLYYSEEDCRYIGGEYEYSCQDNNHNERVVCQCPTSWYSTDGTNSSERACATQGIGEYTFDAESSGDYCDFDGADSLKYKDCTAKCSSLLAKVAVPNAYTYLSSDTSTPTQTMCANKMGNGAVLGYGGQAYCSLNHTTMYPCYCPANMVECLAENNEIAAEGATICSINGKTYYSKCQLMNCPVESSTLAVVDKGTNISTVFGPGAEYSACSQNGTEKLQVTCDASVYTDPCDYPYEAPKSGTWCKYGDDGTLMKNGRPHYKTGACRIQKTLGECGVSVAGGDASANYTIFVAATESECKSKYGPGISTQLCEYGEDQGYKRAYNCYYDADAFKYTTANCGVRHDLTGNYIVVNGQKRWSECNCASAYQHHKFNCGGLLSGNACQQEITQALINSDATLQDAVDEGYNIKGKTLPFYPYCECSADYTEVCDEDGSGRYKGVGQACNGKYTSCECVPDKLPDNWTDNYYGCPGGKKPTGVWKDNGCGKKYYQCTVVECTWEYTEMCYAPLIPVGSSCQDSEGNIGGYKACTCPADYSTCPAGQVGEGEPCNLKGVAYYKSCKSQEACSSIANETCTGPLQIGVNPCTRDDITYYESCICANGYSQACGEGEVGIGNYCEIDGVKYYKECVKPEKNECTAGHVTACDTNQESYSPCVDTDGDGKQIVKYLCKCPSNWSTCGGNVPSSIDGVNIEKCTQISSDGKSTDYYSECNTTAETCSPYQELTYKVCTAAQIGEGGHCLSEITTSTPSTGEDGETVTENGTTYRVKYANCKDSDNCLTNGFRFSCSGYDTSALGESCIDANGNKLYKSCPCPAAYSTCSNPNASKGSKCVPLLESGQFGEAEYSSCECDRSKYKYTCKAEESGNRGIVPPNTSNYCEVSEEVTKTTTDEEGNTVTTTSTEKVKYYTSCDCGNEYKYTCSNADKGERVPTGYDNDYCLINSTKFYKGCGCDTGTYTVSADNCPQEQGQTVDASRGYCSIRGKIPTIITNADGSTTTTETNYGSGQVMYKGCICKPNYRFECDSDLYDKTDIIACTLDESKPLYPRCKCKSDSQKECKAAGKNTGITPDTSSICTEVTADSTGNFTQVDKYTRCTCKTGYSLTCADDDYGWYNQTNEGYCETGETNASGSLEEREYQKCVCNPLVYDNSAEISDVADIEGYCTDQGRTLYIKDNTNHDQYCIEQDASSGTTVNRYRPNLNLCCSSTTTGYTQLDTNAYTSMQNLIDTYTQEGLEAKIKQLCGHEYNADIVFNCDGRPYYKCSNATVQSRGTSGTTWWTTEQCDALEMNRTTGTSGAQAITKSWVKTVTVYPQCDCDSKYKYTSDSQCQNYYSSVGGTSSSNRSLFCTYSDKGMGAGSTRRACPIGIFKLHPTDYCTAADGTKKYARCVCKQGGEATDNEACITDYCGRPSAGNDDYACWVGNIPTLNGGSPIRVSAYNGGGAQNDATCGCPKARTRADLNGCGGIGGTEDVSSCTYSYVTY